MRAIGELEAEVMHQVWAGDGPVTVHQIVDGLNRTHDLAYTTVITIAERLRAKGLLDRQRVGRSFRYHATVTNEQYAAELMGQVLADATDRHGALLQFAEDLPAAEATRLRRALDAAASPSDSGPGGQVAP